MDSRPIVDQSPHTSCIPGKNQVQKPGPVQEAGKQIPSSPANRIRHGAAGTDRSDTDPANTRSSPSNQADTQLPEEYHAHGSDSNVSELLPLSLDDPQHVATSGQAYQAPSLTPSANTQTGHSDISADVTPVSSDTDMISSNAALQHPHQLRISESLGLEGCAGIIGGFIGLLGVFGFLAFLWFGGV